MKEQKFNPDNIWRIYSPRSGEEWFVKCPSRSGAKIFLGTRYGVDPKKGPFYSELADPEVLDKEKIIQAEFYAANDPRNWPAPKEKKK